jgi:hypothetical protein
MKNHLILSASLLALSTCSFADNYSIVVDAGSSGSRLHLYQYDAGKSTPVIQEVFTESTKPGLSAFEKNPQDAGASLKKLFDDATQQLKDKQINPHDVKVNVMATAGMRLLPDDKQQAIYANITDFLQQHYSFSVGKIETIPGEMEALYGWLDVNYVSNNFQKHTPTLGSIDMGGASTEIAFATEATSKPKDLITVKIDGQTYRVFAKSFLGLGQDQAREKMNASEAAGSCYPANYTTGKIVGAFNLATCGSIYADVIQKAQAAEQLISTAKQNFVAYSGAFYAYNFLAADQNPDQANLENRIQTVCTESWDQLKKDYPQTPEKFLSLYCSNAAFMDHLFYGTYQLQKGQLAVSSQINKQDLDWTLGAVLFGLVN